MQISHSHLTTRGLASRETSQEANIHRITNHNCFFLPLNSQQAMTPEFSLALGSAFHFPRSPSGDRDPIYLQWGFRIWLTLFLTYIFAIWPYFGIENFFRRLPFGPGTTIEVEIDPTRPRCQQRSRLKKSQGLPVLYISIIRTPWSLQALIWKCGDLEHWGDGRVHGTELQLILWGPLGQVARNIGGAYNANIQLDVPDFLICLVSLSWLLVHVYITNME